MHLENDLNYKVYNKKYDISQIKKRYVELPDAVKQQRNNNPKELVELKSNTFDQRHGVQHETIGLEMISHLRVIKEKFSISDILYKSNFDGELKSYALPIIEDLEKEFNGKVIRAVFVNLPSGKNIYPHIDEGLYAGLSHRLHVPIITNNNVIYTVGDEKFCMTEVGKLYEINNQKTHAVENLGTEDRIHLVVLLLPSIHVDFS